MDYFIIPGGSTNGDFPNKDRYCGAKLFIIDYNLTIVLLGQQVVTKTNSPNVIRYHTEILTNSITKNANRSHCIRGPLPACRSVQID